MRLYDEKCEKIPSKTIFLEYKQYTCMQEPNMQVVNQSILSYPISVWTLDEWDKSERRQVFDRKKTIYFFLFEMQIARKFVETCATLFFETLRFDEKKISVSFKIEMNPESGFVINKNW